MVSQTRRPIAAIGYVLALGMVVSGCASTSGTATVASRTAMDRAIGQCVAGVVVGAGLGAVIGGITGGNNAAGRGALIGGAVGVGRCAVLVHVAAAEDRERVRQAERAAVLAASSRTTTISTKSGKTASVRTDVAPAPAKQNTAYTTCRYAQQTVTVEGQSASGERQLWCRTETGDWNPIS